MPRAPALFQRIVSFSSLALSFARALTFVLIVALVGATTARAVSRFESLSVSHFAFRGGNVSAADRARVVFVRASERSATRSTPDSDSEARSDGDGDADSENETEAGIAGDCDSNSHSHLDSQSDSDATVLADPFVRILQSAVLALPEHAFTEYAVHWDFLRPPRA